MTVINKQEQHELESKIHLLSPESGVQAIREWVFQSLVAVNTAWPGYTGEQLTKAQGVATILSEIIRVIDKGPKLPRQEPAKLTGGT